DCLRRIKNEESAGSIKITQTKPRLSRARIGHLISNSGAGFVAGLVAGLVDGAADGRVVERGRGKEMRGSAGLGGPGGFFTSSASSQNCGVARPTKAAATPSDISALLASFDIVTGSRQV